MMTVVKGIVRHAAYPIHDDQGRPAWQGVVVREPGDYLWRCPHQVPQP